MSFPWMVVSREKILVKIVRGWTRNAVYLLFLIMGHKLPQRNSRNDSDCEVVIDVAVGVEMDSRDFRGIKTAKSGIISGDRLIIAAGPWTGVLIEEWFPHIRCPMEGIKSTSFVYESVPAVVAEPVACFSELVASSAWWLGGRRNTTPRRCLPYAAASPCSWGQPRLRSRSVRPSPTC